MVLSIERQAAICHNRKDNFHNLILFIDKRYFSDHFEVIGTGLQRSSFAGQGGEKGESL